MRVTNFMCSRCHDGTLCHASRHNHSDDYNIMRVTTPCVFGAIAAHCAMHPHIIIQMITTPCELETPCVFDAMAADCAMHPTKSFRWLQHHASSYKLYVLSMPWQHTVPLIQTYSSRWFQHHASYKLHVFSMTWQHTVPCIQTKSFRWLQHHASYELRMFSMSWQHTVPCIQR